MSTRARVLVLLLPLSVPVPALAAGPLSGGTYQVQVIPDVAYREGPEADPVKQRLDVYLPKGKTDFPVLFFVHGGAWSSGDRKLYAPLGRLFARNGVGTVVISYRLTPKVQHPGHIEDVARAFAWTHRNIARHGGRPDQIFVTGQSAGGHLAALLATNEDYLKAEGLSVKTIKGVMPVSGVYVFPPGRLTRVIGEAPGARESASPLGHVTGKEPPFLILYAENDFPSCDQMSLALDESLRARAVETSCQEIKDRNHISIMVRLMMNQDDPATQELLKFMARHAGLTLTERKVAE
ncbi:MAG: alpha/beta hydrolase [Isosphaeraceae bacterium]